MQNGSENGSHPVGEGCMVELVLVEARDLIAADWGGTSDPYVSVRYGNTKKRTKVIHVVLVRGYFSGRLNVEVGDDEFCCFLVVTHYQFWFTISLRNRSISLIQYLLLYRLCIRR